MVGEAKRRRSIRLRGYDYSQPGAYFVTICTKNRALQFGEIRDGSMILNEHGAIVDEIWKEIPEHFPNVTLDEFIVMPDHIHGILLLGEYLDCKGTACRASTVEGCHASTVEGFGKPIKGSLPTIIRSFKSATTRRINILRKKEGISIWQRNYYEHIIRNNDSLNRIRRYIHENPSQWSNDSENPNHANRC